MDRSDQPESYKGTEKERLLTADNVHAFNEFVEDEVHASTKFRKLQKTRRRKGKRKAPKRRKISPPSPPARRINRNGKCKLRVFDKDRRLGKKYIVWKKVTSIGRHSSCDFILQGVTYAKHAVLYIDHYGTAFLDPMYRNRRVSDEMVFLNGKYIDERRVLNDGDIFTVVNQSFKFNYSRRSMYSTRHKESRTKLQEAESEESETSGSDDNIPSTHTLARNFEVTGSSASFNTADVIAESESDNEEWNDLVNIILSPPFLRPEEIPDPW